ncbi:MAG: S1C family serine protease [Actinomycetaceae bacterium]
MSDQQWWQPREPAPRPEQWRSEQPHPGQPVQPHHPRGDAYVSYGRLSPGEYAPSAHAPDAPVPPSTMPPAGSATAAAPRPARTRTVFAAAALAAVLASGGTAALGLALDDGTTIGADAPASEPGSPSGGDEGTPVRASSSGDGSDGATSTDWSGVVEEVTPSVVAVSVVSGPGEGAGSGVVIDEEGHVLTNAHVVAGAEQVTLTLADGRMFEAEVVGADESSDLAVLAITDPPDDLSPATLGSDADLAVGAPVLAVGNPLGLQSTATTGIVSALDRPVSTSDATGSGAVVTSAIQIDAAINPGNSGGPLFDSSGRVVGINSSIATMPGTGGQSGNIGVGFAIPVDHAARVAGELIEDGTAEHAFLGVSIGDGQAATDAGVRSGAAVARVEDGTPAAEAGLQEGDVIVSLDDGAISSGVALTAAVREHVEGDTVTLGVARDGAVEDVEVTLAAGEARAG